MAQAVGSRATTSGLICANLGTFCRAQTGAPLSPPDWPTVCKGLTRTRFSQTEKAMASSNSAFPFHGQKLTLPEHRPASPLGVLTAISVLTGDSLKGCFVRLQLPVCMGKAASLCSPAVRSEPHRNGNQPERAASCGLDSQLRSDDPASCAARGMRFQYCDKV